jgi:hypothetical protein
MKWFRILSISLFVLVACNFSNIANSASIALRPAVPDVAHASVPATPTPTISHEPLLVETAAELTVEAIQTGILFENKVQTAVAQTLEAREKLQNLIQTAIARTQAAQVPSQTPAPSLTSTVQIVNLIPQVQVTPVPVFDPLFANAYVYKYGFMEWNKYLVTLQLSNNVMGNYRAVIGGSDYKCTIQNGYPNRLYCVGPSIRGGSQAVNIYEDNTNRLVYITQVTLPQWTPTTVKYYNCNKWYCKPPYTCNPTYCNCNYCNYNYDNCNTYGYDDRNDHYNAQGKCYYYDKNGNCRYCKNGNLCK